MALTPAVFLDKDGTLVHDVPYNVDPARLRLRSDAAASLRRLRDAGFKLVLVSNQPGLALRLFEPDALDRLWAALGGLLARDGVRLDGIYFCPHHPLGADTALARTCECRKPAPGLIRRAADELGIDVARSWMVGDILDDVEAGRRAGCRTVMLDVGSETEWVDSPWRRPDAVAASLTAAADAILAATAPVVAPV